MDANQILQLIVESDSDVFLPARGWIMGKNFAEALRLLTPMEEGAAEAWIAEVDTDTLLLRVQPLVHLSEVREFLLESASFREAWMVYDSIGNLGFQCEDHRKGMFYFEWLAKIRLCRTLGELLATAIAYNVACQNPPPDEEP